jgi:lipid II:glycine glycyltransferase (peptidoglycan interpeptide bridge formation enzyme)
MKLINTVSVDLWEQVARRSAYATFFHTPTWSRIIAESFPEYHIATRGCLLDDGLVALVPMVATTEKNGYFRWIESMFPGGYGGAIAERVLTQPEIDFIFHALQDSRAAYIHVMGNPYVDHDLPIEYSRTEEFTHVVNLQQSCDDIYAGYSTEKKRHVARAQKLGVQVSRAHTESEYREYYAVYQDSLRRWGDKALNEYPYGLFERLLGHASDSIQLWVAKVDDAIVSGNVTFYHNCHAVYWHGATLESHFKYHPAPLLMHEAIRDAQQRGFRFYDMNPSGGLAGVERYKEGFGAQRKSFASYTWSDNRVYSAYQKARRLLRRSAEDSHS